MRIFNIVTLCCLLPATYQLLAGSGRNRVIAAASLGIFLVAVLAERWAASNPDSQLARLLFRGRTVSMYNVALLAAFLVGCYLGVVALAIRYDLLENPYVMTVAFFAMFLGLMAVAGFLIGGIQRLRSGRRAS